MAPESRKMKESKRQKLSEIESGNLRLTMRAAIKSSKGVGDLRAHIDDEAKSKQR